MSLIATDSSIDVTELLGRLKKSQQKYKNSSAEDRIKQLRKFQQAIVMYKDDVYEAMKKDFGKPPFETFTSEILYLITEIEEVAANLNEWMADKEVEPKTNPKAKARIVYEPKGTVLVIGAWNFPFCLSLSPVIAAIAAGNNVVVKPSELTPHVSALINKMVKETFEDDFVVVVQGGVDITTQLLSQPFDHFFFTGSPNVGKIVMEAASKHLTSVTLELGGKSPAIIDATADLEEAANKIIKAKTLNAGQICINVDYVLIAEELKDEFIEKMKIFIDKYFIKEGKFDYDSYGQIINEKNFERIAHLLHNAVDQGGEVAFGGVVDKEARRIHPTALVNVPIDADVMKEEIFGPLLPIYTYKDIEEVPAFVAQFDKPLAFYVFSEDQSTVDYLLKNSTSGGVSINDVMQHFRETNLPFGGVNSSGIGKYHGVHGFLELSNARGVFEQELGNKQNPAVLPPYDGKLEALTAAIFKK